MQIPITLSVWRTAAASLPIAVACSLLHVTVAGQIANLDAVLASMASWVLLLALVAAMVAWLRNFTAGP